MRLKRESVLTRSADRSRLLGWALAGLILTLCAGCEPHKVGSCRSDARLRQICAFHSPEDLVDLPGTPWLLVSQQGAGPGAGPLAALDTSNDRMIQFTRGDLAPGSASAPPDPSATDPRCRPSSGSFHAGGMGMSATPDGYRLVVIDHGRRDQVQFFRVTFDGDGPPRLAWQGCVVAPGAYFLNDIAPLPDGGFAATHMFMRVKGWRRTLLTIRFLLNLDTGYVVRWSPTNGWSRIPHSEGSFPNGLDVSKDGRTVFFAETYGHAVNAIGPGGENRRRVGVPMQPDNVTVSPDGSLVVVGGTGFPVFSTQDCPAFKLAGCGFPSRAMRVDFGDRRVKAIVADDGRTIPGMSVGVMKDDALYLGTSFGDRVTRVDLRRALAGGG